MNSIIPAFLGELRHTQFMPREQMIEYQRRLLEPLVRHARTHVPFYRDSGRLAPLFRADDTVDWDRWNEIPLLTRKELQANFETLKSEALPAEHGHTWTLSSSGSTGRPVKVLHSRLIGRDAWNAQLLRDFERHRIDPNGRLAFLHPPSSQQDPSTAHLAAAPKKGWYRALAELGLQGERIDILDTLPAARLVELVVEARPEYMRVQPVAVQLMCANDRSGRLGELGLEAIFTVGERFSPEAKREVSLHLGCRIMDNYASQECGRIATNCPVCTQFHIDAEINLVEVVGENGAPAREGESGWIVVTPFYNYAMPLIRYDHVDFADVGADEGCPIKLPALSAIYGKERRPFVFPDGTSVRPSFPTRMVMESLGAEACQFVQVAPDRCEVRVVPGDRPQAEMQFDRLTEHLRAIWWSGLQVDYRIVDEIPRPSPRAKLQLFVNETGGEAPARPAGSP